MDKMRKAMLIVPIAIGLSGCNDGSSVGLENQDRCAQQAQRYFKADFFEEPTEFSNRRIDKWDYYTHYNSKLNKCFVRMWNIWSNENVARDVLWESQRLVDPFERKVYGSFLGGEEQGKPQHCGLIALDGKDLECKYNFEFERLAKAYMGE